MRTRSRATAPSPSTVQIEKLAHRKDSASVNTLPANKSERWALDGLRFKLSARGELHYFTDVRFGAESAKSPDMLAVTALLNGQCLEELNAEFIAALLGKSAYADDVRSLIKDLQSLLCS